MFRPMYFGLFSPFSAFFPSRGRSCGVEARSEADRPCGRRHMVQASAAARLGGQDGDGSRAPGQGRKSSGLSGGCTRWGLWLSRFCTGARAFIPRWFYAPLSGEGAARSGGRWNGARRSTYRRGCPSPLASHRSGLEAREPRLWRDYEISSGLQLFPWFPWRSSRPV